MPIIQLHDQQGNQVTILTTSCIAFVGDWVYIRPYIVHTHCYPTVLTQDRFLTRLTEPMDNGDELKSARVFHSFMVLDELPQSIHLNRYIGCVPHYIIGLQNAMRMRLARQSLRRRAFALVVATALHPRLGARSLIHTLPTDLVRRIVMLV